MNTKTCCQIVDAFAEQKYSAGTTIIQQGADVTSDEPGLFMLEEGECAAYKGDTKVYTYKDAGGSFGELALLYNAPRAASVKAETDCGFIIIFFQIKFKKVK